MQSPTPHRQPPLWRVYLVFLAPMVLSNFLQSFSGTLNGIYIGQMLGTHALAAISGMFPLVFFFISLVIGLGAGASVLIGQAWGAKQPEKVKIIAGTALLLGALVGLLVALFGGLFTRQILEALGTPANVLEDATAYTRTFMLLMPVLLVFILFTQLLRGVSDTLSPLLALSLSTGVGLLLTPALIRGWLGLPQMGIQSAVLASMLGTLSAMIYLTVRLRRKGHVLAPDRALLTALKFNWPILRKVLRIGLPTSVQMVAISVSELVILSLVNRHGSDATAAYGAVTQIVNYVQFPALSIAITASILGAQAIGGGHAARLGLILRTGLAINLWMTGALIIVVYLLSHWLLGLFLTTPQVLAEAEYLLRIMLWSMLIFGFQSIIGGIMRASGVVFVPVLISVLTILLVQVPVAYLLSEHFGLKGIWMAFPITYITMLVLQSAFYQLVWRHKKIERLI